MPNQVIIVHNSSLVLLRIHSPIFQSHVSGDKVPITVRRPMLPATSSKSRILCDTWHWEGMNIFLRGVTSSITGIGHHLWLFCNMGGELVSKSWPGTGLISRSEVWWDDLVVSNSASQRGWFLPVLHIQHARYCAVPGGWSSECRLLGWIQDQFAIALLCYLDKNCMPPCTSAGQGAPGDL